jgi:hypothetical protein
MPAFIASTASVALPVALNDNAEPAKFIVGREYRTRSICDSNCIFRFKVLARTEKTVTIETGRNKSVRRKITVRDGVEQIYPHGQYSMAPVLRASHQTKLD